MTVKTKVCTAYTSVYNVTFRVVYLHSDSTIHHVVEFSLHDHKITTTSLSTRDSYNYISLILLARAPSMEANSTVISTSVSVTPPPVICTHADSGDVAVSVMFTSFIVRLTCTAPTVVIKRALNKHHVKYTIHSITCICFNQCSE